MADEETKATRETSSEAEGGGTGTPSCDQGAASASKAEPAIATTDTASDTQPAESVSAESVAAEAAPVEAVASEATVAAEPLSQPEAAA